MKGMIKINTRWTNQVDKVAPLQEYPRPQMQRQLWMNLNGEYDYAITDSFDDIPEMYDGKIIVPFSIETPLSGVQKTLHPDECLWYRRFFTLSDDFEEKRVFLNFGAVDWECKVIINKNVVGEHRGGYCPFSFDITDFLIDGENELCVAVFDPSDFGHQQRGKQVMESHGIWYTATSGIWQTVWLEGVSERHIKSVKITPDIDNYCINLDIETTAISGYKMFATIYDEEENEIYSASVCDVDMITLKEFKLWSPEKPNLYNIMLELYHDGTLCDTVVSYFGMRKFSIGEDDKGLPRLFLNNKPYFHLGVLDQGYWPDGGMTAPTDEALVFDIKLMKTLGFNMLRKHVKVEPLRWYYHCDRIGMIVWQDMISGGQHIGNYTAAVLPTIGFKKIKDDDYERFSRGEFRFRQEFEDELKDMIKTLYNCVSIGCWSLFNEGWGQFDANRIADMVKMMDSTRCIDHASGWFDQGGGDLNSIHKYVLKVRKPKLDHRPFVLSEFGGYSRVVDEHVWDTENNFGYKMFKNKKDMTKAYVKLMEKQIVPLISKGLSGIVYTQVSDVESEVNGIMTYDREIMKIDYETIKKLNKRIFSIILR